MNRTTIFSLLIAGALLTAGCQALADAQGGRVGQAERAAAAKATVVPQTQTPTSTATPRPTNTATPAPAAPTATSTVQPTTAPAPTTTAPTAVPTSRPAVSTMAPPGGVSGPCRGDKVATFAEVSVAGPQRQEIGGGGTQHVDYYPDRGVKAVSYIVGPQKPYIWSGFGSIWEWNGQECASYDYVADATQYAKGRLNNGHSGLVIDLRSATPRLVANVANLSQEQIENLLARHRQSQSNSVNAPQGSGQTAPAPQQGTGGGGTSCQQGVREDHPPVVNQTWSPPGDFRVVNFWTNMPGKPQAERKLLLRPGENPALLGGGSSFSWPSQCERQARDEFAKTAHSEVTIDQLKADGLVR